MQAVRDIIIMPVLMHTYWYTTPHVQTNQARSVRGARGTGPPAFCLAPFFACGGLSSTLGPPWIGRAPAAKLSRYGAETNAALLTLYGVTKSEEKGTFNAQGTSCTLCVIPKKKKRLTHKVQVVPCALFRRKRNV